MKKPTLKSKLQQARKQTKAERRQKRKRQQKTRPLRRNQNYIAKKLMAGQVPLVCATAWGYVHVPVRNSPGCVWCNYT